MNKIAIVTGASSGIGLSTSTALAAAGYHVVMVCRDRDRANAAEHIVAAAAVGAPPSMLLADLSSQAEIRSVAHEIQQRFPQVDILINNAGAHLQRTGDDRRRDRANIRNQRLGPVPADQPHARRAEGPRQDPGSSWSGPRSTPAARPRKPPGRARARIPQGLQGVQAGEPAAGLRAGPTRRRHPGPDRQQRQPRPGEERASGTTCTASQSDSAKS